MRGSGWRARCPRPRAGFLLGALLLTVVTGVIALGGGYQLLGWAPVPEGTTRAALLDPRRVDLPRGRHLRGGRLPRHHLPSARAGDRNLAGDRRQRPLLRARSSREPGATWVSSLAIAIEAGGLLAASYVATRSLWMPIGLHWSWNLFEGPVWGSPVSGFPAPGPGGRAIPRSSPAHRRRIRSGGQPAGDGARGALGAWFLVLAVRRGQIVTPAWMWWIAARVRRTAAGAGRSCAGGGAGLAAVDGLSASA